MPRLTSEVKELMAQTKIFPVATASKDGLPNVVPIAFVKVYDDDTILLADNFMNKTFKNLEENPRMSICVWDTVKKQSYQIKGQTTIYKEGKVFDETTAWVKQVIPDLCPKSAILLKITNIFICHTGDDIGKEL